MNEMKLMDLQRRTSFVAFGRPVTERNVQWQQVQWQVSETKNEKENQKYKILTVFLFTFFDINTEKGWKDH